MLGQLDPSPDLADQVYAALLDGICAGELVPGERYTQEALAARLGVSRQPVLQALLLLRRQGLLVDAENRRGVFVAPLDAAFVAALYDVRAALDGLAARSAARLKPLDLPGRAADLIRQGRQAAAQDDLAALVSLDLAFHGLLYEASGNPVLIASAQPHWHQTRRVIAAYLRRARPQSFRGVWDEHEAILQAIVDGHPDAAERLSREHAARSVRLLQPAVDATALPRAEAPASRPPPARRDAAPSSPTRRTRS